jgi:hypothetical protein
MSITKKDLQAAAADAASEELHVITTMRTIRDGEFLADLDQALKEAINASTEFGKPAKLTVTFSLTPGGRTVVIEDDIKTKLPEASKDATVFFVAPDNTLTRTDPKQATFSTDNGFIGAAMAAQG